MIEKNTKEIDEIFTLLRTYLVLPKSVLYRCIKNTPKQATDALLNQMVKRQLIFLNPEKTHVGIRRNFAITPLMEKQHRALEVVLLFPKRLRYHAPMDFPSTIYFLLDEYECEVIVIPFGEEEIYSTLFTIQGESAMKRFVLVDSPEQIGKIHIPNVIWFCRIDEEGKIEKYIQEEV